MAEALSRLEFEALVKRAGLDLAQSNIDDLYSAWPHYERFTRLLRNPARGREAEPAHIFKPLTGES